MPKRFKTSVDELLKFGFKPCDDPGLLFIKEMLCDDVQFGVVHYRNTPEFALLTPNSIIYLGGVRSIDDLSFIRSIITHHEPRE